MDFNKVKKIEDLKKKRDELGSVLSENHKKHKKDFISKTKSDFKTYFEEKGFEVKQTEYSTSARYGEYVVDLSFSSETTSFFGCVAVYNLSINKKPYKIIINRIGSKTNISPSVSLLPNDEEARLDYEIEKLQREIENAENRVKDQTEPKYGYMVADENKPLAGSENYVGSIGELIESL